MQMTHPTIRSGPKWFLSKCGIITEIFLFSVNHRDAEIRARIWEIFHRPVHVANIVNRTPNKPIGYCVYTRSIWGQKGRGGVWGRGRDRGGGWCWCRGHVHASKTRRRDHKNHEHQHSISLKLKLEPELSPISSSKFGWELAKLNSWPIWNTLAWDTVALGTGLLNIWETVSAS